MFCLCVSSFFVFVLKRKGEGKKALAVGRAGRWEGSGRNLGKGKHDKNMLYKIMFFNYKNYEPTPTLRKKNAKDLFDTLVQVAVFTISINSVLFLEVPNFFF